MTENKKTDNNQFEKLKKNLKSNSESTVIEALEQIRIDGEAKLLPSIFELLSETDNPDIEAGIIQLLFDLKNEDAVPYLVNALNNKQLKYYYSFLISAFWQSSLDGSEHLSLFVNIATKGDYMVCLEALTVIENFDATFNEDEVQNCQATIAEAIDREKEKEKKDLLISIQEVLGELSLD